MTEQKKLSYTEAMAEIERILTSLQRGDADIDLLAENVARASELIAMCRERLRKAEADVKAVLESESDKNGGE